MLSDRVRRAAQSAAIACSFVFILAIVALAEDRRQNAPGQFDFYVLALSWSPSYCESAKQRAPNGRPDPQCNGRPFAFIVHGLWPEYEQRLPVLLPGAGATARPRHRLGSTLDLMPSPRLIYPNGTATAPAPGSRRMAISKRCARRARR